MKIEINTNHLCIEMYAHNNLSKMELLKEAEAEIRREILRSTPAPTHSTTKESDSY